MGWLGKVQFQPSITHSSSSPAQRKTKTIKLIKFIFLNVQEYFLWHLNKQNHRRGKCIQTSQLKLFPFYPFSLLSRGHFLFIAAGHQKMEKMLKNASEEGSTYRPCLSAAPLWGEQEARSSAGKKWPAGSERSCWGGGRRRWGYLQVKTGNCNPKGQ